MKWWFVIKGEKCDIDLEKEWSSVALQTGTTPLF